MITVGQRGEIQASNSRRVLLPSRRPDHRRAGSPAPNPFREVFILAYDYCALVFSALPDGIVLGLGELNVEDMLGFVALLPRPFRECGGQLVVHQEAHVQAAITTG